MQPSRSKLIILCNQCSQCPRALALTHHRAAAHHRVTPGTGMSQLCHISDFRRAGLFLGAQTPNEAIAEWWFLRLSSGFTKAGVHLSQLCPSSRLGRGRGSAAAQGSAVGATSKSRARAWACPAHRTAVLSQIFPKHHFRKTLTSKHGWFDQPFSSLKAFQW